MKSILAITDFSVSGNRAVARAALLAAAQGAELTLLHGALRDDEPPPDAADRLAQTVRSLAAEHGIKVHAIACVGSPWARIAMLSQRADLLVLGYWRQQGLKRLLCGSDLERLSHQSCCPLLVVKHAPLCGYRQLLVALDFSPASATLVRLAGRIAPGSKVELFHSISLLGEARRRAASASQEAIEAYRSELRRHARARMVKLSDAFDARRNRVMTTIGRGDPIEQLLVQQDFTGADLLIVSQRRRPLPLRWFSVPMAQRLLGHAGSDVLLVPQGLASPTGLWARLRLQAERC